MKIAYISALFWPYAGGIETIALRFLPAMRDRGHEFVVLTSRNDDRELPEQDFYLDTPVYRFPFLKALARRDLGLIKKCIQGMSEVKKSFQPDLVHLQMAAPISYYHLKTRQVHECPTLLTLHCYLNNLQRGSDTLLGQTIKCADKITLVSQSILKEMQKIYPEIGKCSSVVYNGMEFEELASHPLHLDTPRIIALGSLKHIKGFDIAITAFERLLAHIPTAHLTIAGEGEERAALEKQVSRAGLCNSVAFTGKLDRRQVAALLNASNIMVVPSRFADPFPTVVLEAMLFSRPIVATNLGGIPEMVIHNETGLLVEPDNPQAIADAILHLFRNPERAIEMGQAGYLRMTNHFSWNRFIQSYDDLYRSMMKSSLPAIEFPDVKPIS